MMRKFSYDLCHKTWRAKMSESNGRTGSDGKTRMYDCCTGHVSYKTKQQTQYTNEEISKKQRVTNPSEQKSLVKNQLLPGTILQGESYPALKVNTPRWTWKNCSRHRRSLVKERNQIFHGLKTDTNMHLCGSERARLATSFWHVVCSVSTL